MKRINAWMTFEEILNLYPEATSVFARYGLVCPHCSAAPYETLEIGAKVHGVDLELLLRELNRTSE